MIKIQEKDFILDEEIENINKKHSSIGAVSSFIGYVRNINNNKEVISIELEVYEKMAYKSLENISLKAQQKWNLIDSLIIHRFGNLHINEKIVSLVFFIILTILMVLTMFYYSKISRKVGFFFFSIYLFFMMGVF